MNQNSEVATIKEKQLPIKFSITMAAINKMAKKWAKVPDVSTKEGYALSQEARRELTPMRTAITKEMDLQKEAAQLHIKGINTNGNKLVDKIRDIETPIYKARKAQDEKVAKEKREAEEAEERRILAIEAAVEEIQELTEGLLGADLETIERRFTQANTLVITDAVYMEFIEQASQTLDRVKNQLAAAVDSARALVEQQAEIDRKQKILNDAAEVQRKEDDVRQQKMDQQQAEMDRRQKEFDDREAEAMRLEAEGAERDRLKIKLEAAEKQRIIDDQANAAELAARMPQDIMVRTWMDNILAVEPPDVEDIHLCAVLRDAFIALSDINSMVYNNTQSPVDSDD